MARLTRKFLSTLGIEDENKQDEIIEAHREAVDALKDERDRFKEDAEKLPEVQKELDELKDAAEKNKDNPYKAQYDDLKKEYDDYKADVQARETKTKKETAFRGLLKKAGVLEKRIDSIVKVSTFDGIDLDDNGDVKNADDLVAKLKEEWADFIPIEEKKGAETDNPPKGEGKGGTMSRAAKVAARYYGNMYGEQKGADK